MWHVDRLTRCTVTSKFLELLKYFKVTRNRKSLVKGKGHWAELTDEVLRRTKWRDLDHSSGQRRRKYVTFTGIIKLEIWRFQQRLWLVCSCWLPTNHMTSRRYIDPGRKCWPETTTANNELCLNYYCMIIWKDQVATYSGWCLHSNMDELHFHPWCPQISL